MAKPRGNRYFCIQIHANFWYALLAVAGVLTVSEFLYEHHPHFEIEEIPEFFEIFGFLAFAFIVFAGIGLRKLIMRPEDYYDRD